MASVAEVNLSTPSFCPPSTQNLVASILPPVLIAEMVVGLPGSLLALWIFCFKLKTWMPTTLFLFNLVLADFFLLVSVPFRIDNLLRGEHWVFGGVWCRINLFMLAVNRSASIAFMTAVVVDRYFKVVHPHHKVNHVTVVHARYIAVVIWLLVICLRVPLLATNLMQEDNNSTMCRSFNNYKVTPPGIKLHNLVFVGEFFLPLFVLLLCSIQITCTLRQGKKGKNRLVKRAVRTVWVIVVVFIVCFMPGIITGLSLVGLEKLRGNCKTITLMAEMFSLSIGCTYMNSALDSIIYCFSSVMFRDALKKSINKLGFVHMTLSRQNSAVSDG